MLQPAKPLLLASLLLGLLTSANAAEREQVRIVINLVAAIKMPFPENLPRNRAKTQRVWLELNGATIACLRLEDPNGATSTFLRWAPGQRCCVSAMSPREA
jgi:hypothetical protein